MKNLNKVYIKLENCFGIESLTHEFDFSDDNVYSIYARNGLMKTSLAKTLEMIHRKKINEIADVIFEQSGIADVKIDGKNMLPSDVFVIKSLDPTYESDVSPLLVNADVKKKLKDVLKSRENFLKAVEKLSGIKIKKTSNGKTVYELEETIIRDFGYSEDSILVNAENLSSAIDKMPLNDTPWKKALDIFNERFSVPFVMRISNLKSAIIGESIPHVEFVFSKNGVEVSVNRNQLEELNTLSQGEKRALYLLNIIFDLEQLKRLGKDILIVIDDIADSFDYKNKYAIIEYLYELSENNNFKLLLLSHNYDFYRTVSSRLSIHGNHRLFAETNDIGLTLIQEKYQNQPFKYWKEHPCKKFVLAMIPFIRNLVEYGNDKKIMQTGSDRNFLTMLLHEKINTNNIKFRDLLPIFNEYVGIKFFESDINLEDTIMEELYQECDNITSNDSTLENKIILAMAVRHLAEKYMKNKISVHSCILHWNRGKISGKSEEFLSFVESKSNQTRELMNGFIQITNRNQEDMKILSAVNIMTPENIHFNSFMYEPILDMDIIELLNLYHEAKSLIKETDN